MAKIKDDVSTWRATVAGLAGQLEKAEAELTDLSARRRANLLPARTGDARAAAELERQDARLAKLQAEARDLGQALEDARAELAAAEELAAAAQRARDLARAAELDREVAEDLAPRVDEAMTTIGTTIAQMREKLSEADRLRGPDARPRAPLATVGGMAWAGALSFHNLGNPGCASSLKQPFAASFPAEGDRAEAAREAA